MSDKSSMIINGVEAASDDWLTVVNPALPSETVGLIPAGRPSDVDAAVRAAHAAFPAWRDTPLEERLAALTRAADAVEGLVDEIAPLLTREMGKILGESYADATFSQFLLRLVGPDAMRELAPETLLDDEYGRVVVEREPVGVVAAIVPWNWPLGLFIIKFAAAAAAGNTVVCLPSPNASLALLHMVRSFAGLLPPGVVNVVTGHGGTVGPALVSHPLVRTVAFTGGTATGREILRAGADTITPSMLELGGNDPAIVLDDVEVTEELARNLISGAFVSSGQVCFAVKRIYAAENIYQGLVEACRAVAATTVVGNGLDAGTTMGPLANGNQLRRVRSMLAEAKERGATLSELGRPGVGFNDEGYFQMPVVATDLDESFALVNDEQFAPVIPIIPFGSVEEALRRANDTEFGLSSSVWSADLERARGLARRLETGTTYINQHDMGAVEMSAPYGGFKQSGFGREGGRFTFETFTQLHQITDRRQPPPAV